MHKTITLDDLKQGSDTLLKQIYEDNRDKFINYAKQYNLSDNDIADVYQDAYIAFYDNVMSGRIQSFTSTISTYIISIGKYLILNKLKKNNRTINPDFDISVTKPKEELIDNLDIDREELTTQQQLLYKYYNTLGKKCQKLLDLFYYRGFTIKDILESGTYRSENVIKSTKSRCLKTLKKRIEENAIIK